MYQKAQNLLLVFSLAFNIAFVGIWLHSRNRPEPPRALSPRRPIGAQALPPTQKAAAPLQALKLTPQQRRTLSERWQKLRVESARLNAEVDGQRERLFNLMATENPDWQAIDACEKRIDEGQRRLRMMTMQQMRQLRDVLRPEQHRAFLKMMQTRSEAENRRRGRGLRRNQGERGPGHPQRLAPQMNRPRPDQPEALRERQDESLPKEGV